MATKTTVIKTQIQFRRATTAEWEQYKTVVPAAGEPCFDTELGTLKIGNGVNTYEELGVIGGGNSVSVSGDGTSIVLENSVFKLAGFDAAETGAQPRKNADGNLEWFIPSEGKDIKDLQDRVNVLEGKVNALNGDDATEGSVLKIVKDAIDAFADDVSDDGIVNSFKELVNYVANHGGEIDTIIADIMNLQTLVGGESVSDQIASAIANIDGTGEENVIEAVKVGDNALEIIDKTVTVPIGAGLVASDEVTIADNGTLGVGTVSVSKLVNDDEAVLVLDGGAADELANV